MTHLVICREYPPAAFPPGGIGTYVKHITRLMADAGETVHVIAQRWAGAPDPVSKSCSGRLIIHRVSLDEPLNPEPGRGADELALLHRLATSDCPSQLFSWQAARLAESLVESEAIDLIEAQEWEAPLYYFQVRRALGLGPGKEPPCLIHLHSPSRLIFRHNEWDETLTDFSPLVRFEDYTVKAADALLCPSSYLAHGASELFDIPLERIAVIPYPLGDTAFVERAPEVWRRSSICFVGRLELRKGVVEWVEAAVRVARDHPSVTFDFIGSDTSLSGGAGGFVREHLLRRIPGALRPRFRFHGTQPRDRVLTLLAETPVVAVPSRWENLPYTCIEAMATGVPVLASPNGGMAEIINHGESGWIAPEATAGGFESTLRMVLATSASRKAEMGRAAAEAVRCICGNDAVLRAHLELRAGLVDSGSRTARHHLRAGTGRRGIGVVITCIDEPRLLARCLDGLDKQSQPALAITVAAQHDHRPILDGIIKGRAGVSAVYGDFASPAEARSAGVCALLASAPHLSAIARIGEAVQLDPAFMAVCESALERHPDLGLISTGEDECLSCDVIRVEALPEAPTGRGAALADEFTRAGWRALIYPGLVAQVPPHEGAKAARRKSRARFSAMALAQSQSTRTDLHWFWALPPREKLRRLAGVLKEPRTIGRRVMWSARKLAGPVWVHNQPRDPGRPNVS